MSIGTRRAAIAAGVALTAGAAVHAGPVLTSIAPLRTWLWPGLSGLGRPGHLALTFDDGPDPQSTPAFLDALALRGVRATFFLLGSMLERTPSLGRDLVAAGHEVGVHGWAHRYLTRVGPRATWQDLARARDLVAETTGQAPAYFRPPYGVLSAAALVAARDLGLRPVLWSAWGKDWTPRATPEGVLRTVTRGRLDGGTVLLHDSDCTSAPGAWRSALGAIPLLLDHCAERGLSVGPLGEHALRG
jgi:peptidoglycan/xylan/chitin deacetylase (PgdA/CDA1 family)